MNPNRVGPTRRGQRRRAVLESDSFVVDEAEDDDMDVSFARDDSDNDVPFVPPNLAQSQRDQARHRTRTRRRIPEALVRTNDRRNRANVVTISSSSSDSESDGQGLAEGAAIMNMDPRERADLIGQMLQQANDRIFADEWSEGDEYIDRDGAPDELEYTLNDDEEEEEQEEVANPQRPPQVQPQLPQEEQRNEEEASGSQVQGGAQGGSSLLDQTQNASFDEGKDCSICYEEYTSAGDHRLVCLACGHLFGKSCIEKWLGASATGRGRRGGGGGKCPTCNSKAKPKDIRPIFAACAKGLRMRDTTEKESTLRALKVIEAEKRQLQVQLAQEKERYRQEMDNMRKRNRADAHETNRRSLEASGSGLSQQFERTRVELVRLCCSVVKEVEVCKEKSARIFAVDSPSLLCVATAKSVGTGSLFGTGFGVKKIAIPNGRVMEYVPLHTGVVKDIKFNPSDNGIFLSASFDKTMRLTSTYTNSLVSNIDVGLPVWSCCFKTGETHYVFGGTANGKINLYDTRSWSTSTGSVTEPVAEITGSHGGPPIAYMQWIECATDANPTSRGLLVASLQQGTFFELTGPNMFTPHPLHFGGAISSMSYNDKTKHMLVTLRPGEGRNTVDHKFCQLSHSNDGMGRNQYDFNIVQEFHSGTTQTQMTRNTLFPNPFSENQLVTATYDESQKRIFVRRAADAEVEFHTWSGNVMQIGYHQVASRPLLLSLEQQKLKIFELKRR